MNNPTVFTPKKIITTDNANGELDSYSVIKLGADATFTINGGAAFDVVAGDTIGVNKGMVFTAPVTLAVM